MIITYLFILILLYIVTPILKLKNDKILPFLFCGLLIILMGGQTNNPDYLIYKTIFNANFYIKDPGFGFIIQFLKFMGFNDSNFRLGISLIGFLLISATVFKYLKNRRLFYLFYFIYPFMFDVVQARNFLVLSILTFFIPRLINPNLKNKIIFSCAILVAFTIQKVAILYLPLVFIDHLNEKKYKKIFFRIILNKRPLISLRYKKLIFIS